MAHYEDEYWVQIKSPGWRKIKTGWSGVWDVTCYFDDLDSAMEGLDECLAANTGGKNYSYRIIGASGTVYATYQNGGWDNPADERGATQMGTVHVNLPVHLEKPLNLKTNKVIEKLKANLKKEQDDRAAAEKKEADARADFKTFVDEHEDQIINYLRSAIYGRDGSWKATLDAAEEAFKDDNWATKESKPGRLESELEKFVRVLEMSGDETVEVAPTKELYDLL